MIGAMTGMKDFSSLCVNNLTLCDVFTDRAKMTTALSASIWRQINFHFILFVNGAEFTEWVTDVGHEMPHLPWTMFSYLESAWLSIARFATNYANINVLRTSRPASELDVSDLKKALVVVSSCTKHFRTLFSLGAADKSVPRLCPTQHKFSGEKRAIQPPVREAARATDDGAPARPDAAAPAAKKQGRRKKVLGPTPPVILK